MRSPVQQVRELGGLCPAGPHATAGHTLAAALVMYRVCIAIVDASRARLFSYARGAELDGFREEFIECAGVVNPARGAHADRLDEGFARSIVREVERQLRAAPTQRLVLCASPSILGELRDAADQLHRDDLTINELPHDLGSLGKSQIREKLARYKLLPPPAERIPITV